MAIISGEENEVVLKIELVKENDRGQLTTSFET